MQVEQRVKQAGRWRTVGRASTISKPQLVLAFGPADGLATEAIWPELAAMYPAAHLVGCSTAGEIAGVDVLDRDDEVVVTAIELEHGRIEVRAVEVPEGPDCAALGARLAAALPVDGLVHVFVISEGLRVNGSALVAGMVGALPAHVGVSGGLSGDGGKFVRTVVCLDRPAPTQQIVAIGFYGARLRIGCGSRGGWTPFGPERLITRATGNVLYELDGQPALDLYKSYLGEHAAALPASALLFPLGIRSEGGEPLVRTILGVDEAARSMTFAGDMPVGHRARLMMASNERLVDGASSAAETCLTGNGAAAPDLALLVSCVGRKLVLKQQVEDELDAVRETLGDGTVLTGFYSYGEVSPFEPGAPCELHNQTMTITTISER